MFLLGIIGFIWLWCVPGSYCELYQSSHKYTWKAAYTLCAANATYLVSADTAARSHLNISDVVWTSNVITRQAANCGPMTRYCGIRLINNYTPNRKSSTLYADCNVPHMYACKDGGKTLYQKNATYDDAMNCQYSPSIGDILSLPTGYYWIKSTRFYCHQQPLGVLNVTHNAANDLCGVYREGFGLAFGTCSESHYALCTSASSISLHSTTPERVSHTSVESRNPTQHQQVKTYSTRRSSTATSVSLQSTSPYEVHHTSVKPTYTTQHQPVTTYLTRRSSKGSPVSKQTPSMTTEGEHHNNVEHTYTTKPQQGATDAAHSNSVGVGVKIGVPVGVCVVIICGVIVVVLFVYRRRRQKRGNEETDISKKGTGKMCVNGMYALQTSVPVDHSEHSQSGDGHIRVSYNKTQDETEAQGEYEYLDEREIRHISEERGNKSRNIHNKARNCSAEGLDKTEECSADYGGKQTSHTCDSPDDHVYNDANDEGEYDSIVTKHQAGVKPDDVYNHVSHSTDIENDYDTTIPGKVPKHQQTNNVYSTFTGGVCDETNDYDFTESMAGTKCADLEDNTYNTLYTQ